MGACSQMMEMPESKLFLGNMSVCGQLSGRGKARKLECSNNIKSSCVVKDVQALLLKKPNIFLPATEQKIIHTVPTTSRTKSEIIQLGVRIQRFLCHIVMNGLCRCTIGIEKK